MTDDELRDEALAAAVDEDASRARLVAEVRRLKGLVKGAEWSGYAECLGGDEGVCPWCGNMRASLVGATHAATCHAFTPDGAVR